MTQLSLLFALVLAINLMPAFAPPTWMVVVLWTLDTASPVWAVVAVAAGAAATGRFLLGHGFRLLGHRVPERTQQNLAALHARFEANRKAGYAALGLFAFTPLASAQLFEAAGLARVPLLGFTLAFFSGRVLSYSLYATGAHSLRHTSVGELLRDTLTSPWGLAGQALMLALLVAMTQVNWATVGWPRLRKQPAPDDETPSA